LARWQENLRRDEQFVALLQEGRTRLEKIYAAAGDVAARRADKARVLHELERTFLRLKQSWGGYSGYDRWFAAPLNNARLASVGTYRSQLPAFQVLLQQAGGDLAAFYRAADVIGRLSAGERRHRMHVLAAAASRNPGPDIARLWDAPPEG
jgi:predicted aminopeptidase